MPHRFTVHSGGDGPTTLKDNFIAVMEAARVLDEALRNAAPHARNYYTQQTAEEDFRDDRNEYDMMRARAATISAWAEEGAMRVLARARG